MVQRQDALLDHYDLIERLFVFLIMLLLDF
nr:MAG TPA: agnoprotein [Caudoviricetes sp.]